MPYKPQPWDQVRPELDTEDELCLVRNILEVNDGVIAQIEGLARKMPTGTLEAAVLETRGPAFDIRARFKAWERRLEEGQE